MTWKIAQIIHNWFWHVHIVTDTHKNTYKNNTDCFKEYEIICDPKIVQDVPEKLISFCNLKTWLILFQMVSNLNYMHWNNFY